MAAKSMEFQDPIMHRSNDVAGVENVTTGQMTRNKYYIAPLLFANLRRQIFSRRGPILKYIRTFSYPWSELRKFKSRMHEKTHIFYQFTLCKLDTFAGLFSFTDFFPKLTS